MPDEPSPRPGAADDLVTVVVPMRNEAAHLDDLLGAVLGQTHRNLQVLVVDGCSDDGSRAILERWARNDDRLEILDNPDRVIPMALNRALDHARGRWWVRIDAHCTVPADYVERIVARLAEGRWGGVGGAKIARGRTVEGHAVAAAMSSPFGVGNSVYHYGTEAQPTDHIPFGAYPVELIRSLGGWKETQLVNEDYEFDYRVRLAGHELLFDPEVRVDWYCRQSIADLFRQYRRYGRGKVETVVAHPEATAVRHLVAPGLVAWLALASLIGLRRPRAAALMAAPYVLGVGAATVITAPKVAQPAARRFLPAAFAAMHLGWGIGFWAGLIAVLRGRSATTPAHAASARH